MAQSGPWRFSWRAAGLPQNLTFAEIVEEIRVHVSGCSRAASDDRATVAAERLHQKAANWSYRPSAVVQLARKRTPARVEVDIRRRLQPAIRGRAPFSSSSRCPATSSSSRGSPSPGHMGGTMAKTGSGVFRQTRLKVSH